MAFGYCGIGSFIYTKEHMGGYKIHLGSLASAWRAVRRVRTWQLVVILFFMLLLAASLLRYNNLGMIVRRQAVITADTSGNKVAIKASLVELQHYVSGHMNTSLGNGVYLEHAYEADRAAAVEAAANTSNPSSAVYQQASIECRSRFVGGVESFRNDYVRCVIDRVSSLQAASDAPSVVLPRLDNYRYNFAPPLLSLDAAGAAVVICALLTGVIALRLLRALLLAAVLRRRLGQA